MRHVSVISLGIRGLAIEAEGDNAGEVTEAFMAALTAAGTAARQGERVAETRTHLGATVSVWVEPRP